MFVGLTLGSRRTLFFYSLQTYADSGHSESTFDDINAECLSSFQLQVFDNPVASFAGDSIICVNETISLNPSPALWFSSEPSIATVDNNGNVTGISPGIAFFSYTDDETGCGSNLLSLEVLEPSDPECLVNTNELETSSINIYPNPFSDLITIDSKEEIQSIELYNVNHQKVITKQFTIGTRNYTISTEYLQSGFYILAVKSNGKTNYNKIIKE